jgi:CheY-like chemotaxis protein
MKRHVSRQTVSVRIPRQLKEHALKKCQENDVSLAELFRQALIRQCASPSPVVNKLANPNSFVIMTKQKNLLVLLVDDSDVIRQICRNMLESAGFSVLEANCGKNAYALWQKHAQDINLLITDYDMPDMNGFQLCNAIRANHPLLGTIIMSGSYEPQVASNAVCDIGFIKKPFFKPELINLVHQRIALPAHFASDMTGKDNRFGHAERQ